ncbi:unnamed protein product [Brassicogethes aeneus]|uniref:Uncharacterized protein n=1 Tax=Brassicogethes aeneus TaxID=1431903 RepID=A0A9P0BD50_BRAAE|nr:unnamed protein product [Brassicogethes aeneus]
MTCRRIRRQSSVTTPEFSDDENVSTIRRNSKITTGADLEHHLQKIRLVVLPSNDFPSSFTAVDEAQARRIIRRQSSVTPEFSDDEYVSTIRRNSTVLAVPEMQQNLSGFSLLSGDEYFGFNEEDEEHFESQEANQDGLGCHLVFPSLPEDAVVESIMVSKSNCVND